jgi:hypothetical protein
MKMKRRQKQGSWKMEVEELEVGKQAQTIVNPVSGNRLPNFYTAWISRAPW